jgi:hypothetical protein
MSALSIVNSGNAEMKSREIIGAIEALDEENHREAAINQLILSGNSNPEKLSYLLNKITESLSKSKESSLVVQTSTIILGLSHLKENIAQIISKDEILSHLVYKMTSSLPAAEALKALSASQYGQIKNRNHLSNLLHNIGIVFASTHEDLFEPTFLILHNLLSLSETRELIPSIDEFHNRDLYLKFYRLQHRHQRLLIPFCDVLMQVSRSPVSHHAIYSADGIIPLLVTILKEPHHHSVKTCLICLMNLSSERTICLSMVSDRTILQPIISLSRQQKGKIRQCSLGVLMNLSFAAIDDPQVGLSLMQFPQCLEVIIFSMGAVSEVTTRCYGVGILCNFTSCLENKISFIQLPLASSLLSIFAKVLSSDEENVTQSPASPLASSSLRRHQTKYWTFKSDCCQVLFNLSTLSSSLQESKTDVDSFLTPKLRSQIIEWNHKMCFEKNLLTGCLFTATRSPSQHLRSQSRRNCLGTIDHLILNLSDNQSPDSRQLLATIGHELEAYAVTATSADFDLITGILEKISPSDVTTSSLTRPEGKMSSSRASSKSHKKQSHSSMKQHRHLSPPAKTIEIVEAAAEKKSSADSPLKKSTFKGEPR